MWFRTLPRFDRDLMMMDYRMMMVKAEKELSKISKITVGFSPENFGLQFRLERKFEKQCLNQHQH